MKETFKILILVGILMAGIFARQLGLFEADQALAWLYSIEQSWWIPPAMVAAQLIMYMLAFPGSLIMWTLGAIYQPWIATSLVVAGGVSGSLAAYFFASSMTSAWTAKFASSTVYRVLQNNSGFLQLCALRCLPGFPHSFINYCSGMLRISLLPFIISTTIGFAFKGFIYCSAIYSAIHLDNEDTAISISSFWPLIVLVIFSLLGVWIQKKYFSE